MQITTTTLYCDRCGKILKKGYMQDMYNIPIAYKSIIWGFGVVKVSLCKDCTKEYFKVTKQFLQKAEVDDKED